jgi:hypothetical protein
MSRQWAVAGRLWTAIWLTGMLALGVVVGWPGEVQAEAPWVMHVIDDPGGGPDGVRFQDVNGDGRPDVTSGAEQGGITRACLNPGPAQVRDPWPCVTVGSSPSVEESVFVDLDADGAFDVLSSLEGSGKRIQVHWAPASPAQYLTASAWTTQIISASTGILWMTTTPLQIDGRHGVDFFAGSKESGAKLGWFEAPADPRTVGGWTFHLFRSVGWVLQITPYDMEGDGDLDVIVTDRHTPSGASGYWLENPGPGHPSQTSPWTIHDIGGSSQLLYFGVGDLDQDGLVDIVAAQQDPSAILFFRRLAPNGLSWQTHEIAWPSIAGPKAKAATVADFNGDGRLDIVASSVDASGKVSVLWLSYASSPFEMSWQAHEINTGGTKFDRIEVLDLDGDGDLDVSTTEETDNLGVLWWENPFGPGTVRGDVDGNHVRNLADLRKLMRMLTGQEPPNEVAKTLAAPADRLTLADARELVQLLVAP